MPIYEYQCGCGKEVEVRLSFGESDLSQTCECGKPMRHKVSLSSFVMKQTGRGMALDTLNSKQGMPDKHWKAKAERFAVAGL